MAVERTRCLRHCAHRTYGREAVENKKNQQRPAAGGSECGSEAVVSSRISFMHRKRLTMHVRRLTEKWKILSGVGIVFGEALGLLGANWTHAS
jgi:hypothetical protein